MTVIQENLYGELEIVSFLKKKDRSAFNYLYKKYAPYLWVSINKIVLDQQSSEDIMLDVFVKIWYLIGQFNPENGRLLTWMLNIAQNAAKEVVESKIYQEDLF